MKIKWILSIIFGSFFLIQPFFIVCGFVRFSVTYLSIGTLINSSRLGSCEDRSSMTVLYRLYYSKRSLPSTMRQYVLALKVAVSKAVGSSFLHQLVKTWNSISAPELFSHYDLRSFKRLYRPLQVSTVSVTILHCVHLQ